MSLLWLACAVVTEGDSVPPPPGIEWPAAMTTLVATVVPGTRLATTSEKNPGLPEGLAEALALGLGGWTEGPGESWITRDDLLPGASTGGGQSVVLFAHQSDAQVADAESPTRVVAADALGETQAALRPQELHAVHALDAMVRRLDELHDTVGIDFLLATGDNADSVQLNETRWFRDTLDGSRFTPDSGPASTQPDEEGNDPVAPFSPVGLDFPWYAVAGNHDVLVQGNFAPDDFTDDVLGQDAPLGTRDLGVPGGPLSFTTVADPERSLLQRSDIAAVYLESPSHPGPVGHGFSEVDVANDTVTWTAAPVPGVRVIALDANPAGPGDGMLTVAERDGFLVPALEEAEAAGELVIVTSHYAIAALPVEGGGVVGDLLQQHPNVVLTVAGHWHVNRVAAYGTPGDPGAFWEIQTASTTDWPGQVRLVELVDQGSGTLAVYSTMVDYPAPEGSLAAAARRLTLVDWQSGWRSEAGSGEATDRNVVLLQALPTGWTGGTGGVRSEALP